MLAWRQLKIVKIIIYIKHYHSLILPCLPTLFCILSKENVMCCAHLLMSLLQRQLFLSRLTELKVSSQNCLHWAFKTKVWSVSLILQGRQPHLKLAEVNLRLQAKQKSVQCQEMPPWPAELPAYPSLASTKYYRNRMSKCCCDFQVKTIISLPHNIYQGMQFEEKSSLPEKLT